MDRNTFVSSFSINPQLAIPTTLAGIGGGLGGYALSRNNPVRADENNPHMTDVNQFLQDSAGTALGTSYGAAGGLIGGVLLNRAKYRQVNYSKKSKLSNFSIPLVPNVPFKDAPPGVRPLVLGSQAGAVIGGGMGLEKTIQDAQEENQPLPKALAKGALNVAGGATLGTLTGLGGGVLLNRARGINNANALNYANKYTFGEPTMTSGFSNYKYMSKTANFMNLVKVGAGLGAAKGLIDQPGGMMVDPNTGEVVNRSYTPLERITNIGMNAAVGAGLGLGANKLKLNDPNQLGRYMGQATRYGEDKLAQANKYVGKQADKMKQHLPEVEIRTGKSNSNGKPLPKKLQDTVDAASKRKLN